MWLGGCRGVQSSFSRCLFFSYQNIFSPNVVTHNSSSSMKVEVLLMLPPIVKIDDIHVIYIPTVNKTIFQGLKVSRFQL